MDDEYSSCGGCIQALGLESYFITTSPQTQQPIHNDDADDDIGGDGEPIIPCRIESEPHDGDTLPHTSYTSFPASTTSVT